MNTLEILKGGMPSLTDIDDLRALWCVVYDGPVAWEGRTAFEQIKYLEERLKEAERP